MFSQCSQSSRCANSRSPGRLEDEQRVPVAPRGSGSLPVHGPGSGSPKALARKFQQFAHITFSKECESLGTRWVTSSVIVQTSYPKHTHTAAGLNLS